MSTPICTRSTHILLYIDIILSVAAPDFLDKEESAAIGMRSACVLQCHRLCGRLLKLEKGRSNKEEIPSIGKSLERVFHMEKVIRL